MRSKSTSIGPGHLLAGFWLMAALVGAPGLAQPPAPAPTPEEKARQALARVQGKILAYAPAEARGELEAIYNDGNPDHVCARGQIFAREKNYEQAEAHLRRATQMRPGDPALWSALGESLRQARNEDAAKEAFQRAVALAKGQLDANPEAIRPHYLLGVARQGLGQFGESSGNLEKSRELEPGNPLVAYRLGITRYYQQRWQEAVDLLTESLDKNPGNAYGYYFRGRAASQIGRKDLLVSDLERFLEMAPQAPEAPLARRVVGGAR